LTLLNMVGPAVALHVAQTLNAAYPDRFAVSTSLARLAEAGIPITDRDGAVLPEALALLSTVDADTVDADTAEAAPTAAARPGADTALSAEAVRQRALDALAQEIRIMLDEGVVAHAQDIDLCLILGAGWPFHLGGITPYLDHTGISERVTGARLLSQPSSGTPSFA
jgi:3-hydroxyacyl-CoA dehydrogenase